jgi:hypothetical protein
MLLLGAIVAEFMLTSTWTKLALYAVWLVGTDVVFGFQLAAIKNEALAKIVFFVASIIVIVVVLALHSKPPGTSPLS